MPHMNCSAPGCTRPAEVRPILEISPDGTVKGYILNVPIGAHCRRCAEQQTLDDVITHDIWAIITAFFDATDYRQPDPAYNRLEWVPLSDTRAMTPFFGQN